MNLADVLNQFGSDASEPRVPHCSRAGCREAATVALLWRNPKLHAPDRRKTWLACAEHEGFLHAFLSARSFPVSVVSVTEVLAGDGELEA